MKTLILMMIFGLNSYALSPKKNAPLKKVTKAQVKPVHPVLKKEEDCDDKAKKPIEIKPETISLSGNTGCSLPE